MENKKRNTPSISRKRFPLYLSALQQLKQRGEKRAMSYQIGYLCNVNADTVRRDLMYVNHKSKTAAGYDIDELIFSLNEELGTLNGDEPIIMIGVGNIGAGLIKYNYIPSHVGRIVCAYDIDPSKIGKEINGVPVYAMDSIKQTIPEGCKIAILAIPNDFIDEIVSVLVSLKIRAIINFSDRVPRKRNGVTIHQVDLARIVSEIIYDFKIKEQLNEVQ